MSETKTLQTPPAILFVDDEATAVKYFHRAIGQLVPVVTGQSVQEGKAQLDAHGDSIAVLVSDQRMPGECGNELLRYAREHYPHIVRILTTAYSEIDQTVEAVNQGQIHRYIKKPWDITALRMELKQALELSALRRERDQLVHEKLMVLQKQTVATRIAMVQTLCASLIGPGRFQPVETYLKGTSLAKSPIAKPDWQRLDYADVVSAESQRNGAFGYAVGAALGDLRSRFRGQSAEHAIAVLADVLGNAVRHDGDVITWTSPAMLSEFIAMPVTEAVSAQHAAWLAALLWQEEAGGAFELQREGDTVSARIGTRAESFGSDRLAVWIDQIIEA